MTVGSIYSWIFRFNLVIVIIVMKGTFNQGWWNCFESFAAELLFQNEDADDICINVLRAAGITSREAQAWLDKPIERRPKVEAVVREYFLKYCK